MAGNRQVYQEAIRLYVEASGDDELKQLVKSLGDVGDVADDVGRDAAKALDGVADAAERLAKIDAFAKLKRDVGATEAKLESAQVAAQKLFHELSQGDDGSAKLTRAQSAAAKTVNDLSDAAQRQRLQLQKMRGELSAVGVDTRQLGSAQGRLRGEMAGAREALARSADSVRQYRAESKRAANQVPRDNREIAQSYTLVERGLGRLRGIAAGALAYLGFREAIQGAKNLGEVAAQAEDARRALQNMYGTQEAGNRAYDELRQLSKDNGLAFDRVVESAKKLKAFGLDPLNGSLQALIDQNAAVGGSQEDLEGKILALGQAWAKQKLQGEEILQLVERGVPVWDLLQKVTGKNVTELQKLSAAGKLGRDVIKGLYEELGRANSGAANRALSSTSGLLAQITAQWLDFKQKIVDAGLGDYFKRQMQELLSATGGFDGLATRVSAGIVGTLDAIKSLGAQLAVIAKPIGSLGLALARHADAVLLLGKVYLGLKLAQWASSFATLARNTSAAAASTSALTAAEVARTGGLSKMGGVLAKIPRAVTVAFAVVGLEVLLHGIDSLNKGLEARNEAIAHGDTLQSASQQLQQQQLQLGRQLQGLYKESASTVIASGQQVSQMTRDQASDYLFALESARKFYGGVVREARAAGDAQREATATTQWKALGEAVTEVTARLKDVDAAASKAAGIKAMANAAVAEFDKLIAKGKQVREAVDGIFDGIDFGSDKGITNAISLIEQIGARGTEAASAIRAELRVALGEVSASDLPSLKAAAEAAFGAGTAAAKVFASEVDRVNLTRLGVDVDAIKTGFTEVGRAAVDAFNGAVDEIDKLGLTVEQRSAAIAQAFDNAFKQASTKAELAALKASLQDALSTGAIGFKEFQQRVTETDEKLAALGNAGLKVGENVAAGARTAADSLAKVGEAAQAAGEGTEKVAAGTEQAADSMGYGSKKGEQFALSIYSVSDAAIEAYSSINKLAGSPLWADGVIYTTKLINEQGDQLTEQVKQLQAANAEFDELAQRREQLSSEFDLLGASEIEKLVQAEKQLESNRSRAAQERTREVEKQQADLANKKKEAERSAKERADEAKERAREAERLRGDDGATSKIAQREATEAAVTVTDMLSRAKDTATALSTAATTMRGAVGEVVVRFINDPSNAQKIVISDAQMRQISTEVFRLVAQSKRSST